MDPVLKDKISGLLAEALLELAGDSIEGKAAALLFGMKAGPLAIVCLFEAGISGRDIFKFYIEMCNGDTGLAVQTLGRLNAGHINQEAFDAALKAGDMSMIEAVQ